MRPAIRIERLSKRYTLGARASGGYRTIRESFADACAAPLRRLSRTFRRRGRNGDANAAPPEVLWALKDVSFEVQPGEVVGIIGRNGAGKSTLLKILSRITEPHAGRVELQGRVGSLLEIGTGFHPELTGRENIFLNGAILGMSRREIIRKFDEIVAFSEVEQFLDTPVKRYSSGMYMRLAFAVAAHLDLEVLLVDEVLAVGDQAFQKKCLGKMDEVSRSGRTALFVSHNMASIMNLCEHVVVLDRGRLAFAGEAKKGIDLYLGDKDTPTGGEIDLVDHPARRPGSRPILQKVRLLNAEGATTDQFLCGDPFVVELWADPRGQAGDIQFNVRVEDSSGVMLFSLGTHITDSKLSSLTGPMHLVCRTPELPLAPDRYFLTLNAGSVLQTWADSLEQVVSFDVVPSDYYGNGRLPSVGRGRFVVRSQWTATAAECGTRNTESGMPK